MADELSRKRETSLPRAYGSSSRAMFLMRPLRRLPSKFSYLRIKELSNTHPDCGCYRKEYTLVKKKLKN